MERNIGAQRGFINDRESSQSREAQEEEGE